MESLLHDCKVIKNKTINQSKSITDVHVETFFKKYDKLPAKTEKEFRDMNLQLENDTEFRSNFVSILYTYTHAYTQTQKTIYFYFKRYRYVHSIKNNQIYYIFSANIFIDILILIQR